MNNSQRFSYAHKVARQTVAIVGDYQIAFAIALRNINASIKREQSFSTNVNAGIIVGLCIAVIACVVCGMAFDVNTALVYLAKVSLVFVVAYTLIMNCVRSIVDNEVGV